MPVIKPDPARAILASRLEASPFLPEAHGRTDWFLELVRDAYAAGFTDSRTEAEPAVIEAYRKRAEAARGRGRP
jgi:hypothetical protein